MSTCLFSFVNVQKTDTKKTCAGAGALDLCLLGNCLGAGAGLALGDATASGTGGALKPRAIATGKPRPFIS